jgi:acetyltransferase-like isoleucine patch superfamily enzyme
MLVDKLLSKFEAKLSQKKLALFKTIYINFRCLPFRQAIRFPIKLYGKIRIKSLSGNICIKDNGSLKLGVDQTGYRTRGSSTISLYKQSRLEINGNVLCYQGSSIMCGEDSVLTLNDKVTIGDGAEIVCRKKIILGYHVDLTWDCQLTDFGSHTIENLKDGLTSMLFNSVEIGDYCWIGNRTTIMPGTKLPNRTIVGSNSLLNKDYILLGVKPYSLIAGIPAKLIKEGIRRIDY